MNTLVCLLRRRENIYRSLPRYVQYLTLHGGLDLLGDVGGKGLEEGVDLLSLLLLVEARVVGDGHELGVGGLSGGAEAGDGGLVSGFSLLLFGGGLGLEGVKRVLKTSDKKAFCLPGVSDGLPSGACMHKRSSAASQISQKPAPLTRNLPGTGRRSYLDGLALLADP